jgi:AraC family transcriptional activator of mtrCDE
MVNNANPNPNQPLARPSTVELNRLLATLEVKVVRLTECLVSRGWRLEVTGPDAPGIHYNLMGKGWLVFENQAPIALRPHTLIIVPPGLSFALEADAPGALGPHVRVQDLRRVVSAADSYGRREAGDPPPDLILICGYFQAIYGASIDLFSGLTAPIVEQFDAADRIDNALRHALDELLSQEVGDGVMAAALLKQVMVMLLRRSLASDKTWAERFSILSDPQVARAFADMVEHPGAPHTVQSLARTAGLSRSAFMDRFRRVFSKAPMTALRDLRMRRAARELVADQASLDQVAYDAGYQDRTGFLRAFRKVYGCDPADFRAAVDKGDLFIGV